MSILDCLEKVGQLKTRREVCVCVCVIFFISESSCSKKDSFSPLYDRKRAPQTAFPQFLLSCLLLRFKHWEGRKNLVLPVPLEGFEHPGIFSVVLFLVNDLVQVGDRVSSVEIYSRF